ncbi:unnamed protein product, partial [Mesorhabditis belari]|uniref:Uncharacterized protein n=1 Tax=Mesorhabditis belari TaxID=2138241 RepID=A0AAF3FJW1_9BILA
MLLWYLLHAISLISSMGSNLFNYWSQSGCALFVSTLFCDITLYVALVYLSILWNENFSSMVPYCTLGNKYTAKQTLMFLIFSPIVDIISLLILLFLTLKRKSVKVRTYDLSSNFTIAEKRNANLMLLPFSALHFIIQLSFLLIQAYLPLALPNAQEMRTRTIFLSLYLYSFYTVAGCLSLRYILRRIREKRQKQISRNLEKSADERLIHESYSKYW